MTPRTHRKNEASTWLIIVFPFCLATIATMRRKRKRPFGLSSRAWTKSHSSHGSKLRPRTSTANSMTAKPSDVSGVSSLSGGVNTRGSVRPSSFSGIFGLLPSLGFSSGGEDDCRREVGRAFPQFRISHPCQAQNMSQFSVERPSCVFSHISLFPRERLQELCDGAMFAGSSASSGNLSTGLI